jgi:hypothetical protein
VVPLRWRGTHRLAVGADAGSPAAGSEVIAVGYEKLSPGMGSRSPWCCRRSASPSPAPPGGSLPPERSPGWLEQNLLAAVRGRPGRRSPWRPLLMPPSNTARAILCSLWGGIALRQQCGRADPPSRGGSRDRRKCACRRGASIRAEPRRELLDARHAWTGGVGLSRKVLLVLALQPPSAGRPRRLPADRPGIAWPGAGGTPEAASALGSCTPKDPAREMG